MKIWNIFKKEDKSTKKLKSNSKEMETVETWKLVAHGQVQGVGFRWSVQTLAQDLNINGTVRNNADMTVTIMLQADTDKVNNFIEKLPNSLSPFAHIEKIDKEKLAGVEKMHGFHVLY